jgi:hypothetical protein
MTSVCKRQIDAQKVNLSEDTLVTDSKCDSKSLFCFLTGILLEITMILASCGKIMTRKIEGKVKVLGHSLVGVHWWY